MKLYGRMRHKGVQGRIVIPILTLNLSPEAQPSVLLALKTKC